MSAMTPADVVEIGARAAFPACWAFGVPEQYREEARQQIRAALSALSRAGLALVQRDCTPEMRDAANTGFNPNGLISLPIEWAVARGNLLAGLASDKERT